MSSPYSQQPGQGQYPVQSGPPAAQPGQQGQPAQQGQHPGAVLDLRPGFFPLLWILYLCKPSYSINGSAPIQGQWKQNTIPVPPGRYEVTIWVKYLFYSNMGRNSVVVDVPPGAAATIVWRSPWLVFLKGRITSTVGAIGGGQEQQQQGQQQGPQAGQQAQGQYAQGPQGYQQGQPAAQQGYQQQPAQQQTPAQQYGYQQQAGQGQAAPTGQGQAAQGQAAQGQAAQAAQGQAAQAGQHAQAASAQSGQQSSAQSEGGQQGGAQQAPGGWHPDPTHRHQMRYYDGQKWTDHVSDSGVQGQDPIAS